MQNLSIMSKLFIILVMMSFSLNAYTDDEEGLFKRWFENKNNGISAVKFEQYNDLCGSCHFSYQPGLLPGISWENIMSHLNDHFGQTVAMTDVEIRTIRRYLLDNSAGHVNDEISNQILQSLRYNPVPVRITKTPFFMSKHNSLYKNKKFKNMRQCDSCHQDARQGYYDKQKLQTTEKGQGGSSRAEIKM